MSLKEWEANGWLRAHKTSRQEIQNLFAIVRRDLADARATEVSADWRFGIAYNAALKLCTILLYAEGYRPMQSLAHYRTLQALPLILGKDRKEDADYLVAPLGSHGAELYIYPNEATIFGAKPHAWFEEWDYPTPSELIQALAKECASRVA